MGVITAIAALDIIGFDFALFASSGGIVFASVAAFWIGAGVAALIDPRRAGRNGLVVATAIAASVVVYLAVVSSRSGPLPAGTSTGGPNVPPP
jgi:apolipoprotein N-acyltransferase